MLTCYDFTTARLMQRAGIPAILVGDSASNVILGHDTTVPISLDVLIDLTAAVRRGAPQCLLMADMTFGSYQESTAQGLRNGLRMAKRSGCDMLKLEVTARQLPLVRRLADAGVAVVAHLGLRPQSIGVLGSYKAQGRTPSEANAIVKLAGQMQRAGAAAILLEAVAAETAARVVADTSVPVIGCGAGPDVHAHVIVLHDLLGLSDHSPRFAPQVAHLGQSMLQAMQQWADMVSSGRYPTSEQSYHAAAPKPS